MCNSRRRHLHKHCWNCKPQSPMLQKRRIPMATEKRVRHILSLSGGKDSAALALYMRDRIPTMEYIFSDTRKELPETYEYLERISSYLGKDVIRLNADIGFDH